jgi:phosphoribosylformylglycinamidine synthase
MLLTVPAKNLECVLEIFEKEDVEATAIGTLTKDRILLLTYMGETVAEMDVSFLFEPPETVKTAKHKPTTLEEPSFPETEDLTETLLQLLASPNIACKESVVRSYDHEVKGNTVLKPLCGRFGGPNDASVLKPLEGSWNGIAVSCGINPQYGKIDAYWMAASAIDEALRNNVAVGGRRIALLDNFTWGNPDKPERLGSLVRACEACCDFSAAFKTPFISGKDSLYNESPLGAVTPTLLITALGILPDVRSAVSMEAKAPGDLVYVIGVTLPELGGSEYYRLKGFLGRSVPEVQAGQARKTFSAVTEAIDSGLIRACHDLSEGGLAVAAAEMAFSGGYGMKLDLRKVPRKAVGRNDFVLFSESNSRFLAEVSEKAQADFEARMKSVPHAEVGKVTKASRLEIRGLSGNVIGETLLSDLLAHWKGTLSGGV